MRRFPVRGLSIALLALTLSVLPTVAAQASPWSVSPLQGGWFAKVEVLLARVLVRWSAGAEEAPAALAPQQQAPLKEGAIIDPNGQT